MRSKAIVIVFASLLIVFQFCSPVERPMGSGAGNITLEGIRAHLKFLSDDLFEGRGTGSRGLELAGKYVAAQFESYGILPGGENGAYFQEVPMVGYTTAPSAVFEFVKGNERILLRYRDDYVANTARAESRVTLDKEIVFVGYGIDAPEQNWNDYSGQDVRDKILLMTVNDPPSDDPEFFGGKTLTYYGRWTYKNEIAGEKGAAGIILIHSTEKAGYPWQVVRNS